MKWMLAMICVCTGILVACATEGQYESATSDELGQAAKDEFTSQFLVSTEEEEEGFCRMRGELGGFEMLIPRDAKISDVLHSVEDDRVEGLVYTFNDNKKQYNVKLSYKNVYPDDLKQSNLIAFAQRMGYEEEFNETEINGSEVYYGMIEEGDEESSL